LGELPQPDADLDGLPQSEDEDEYGPWIFSRSGSPHQQRGCYVIGDALRTEQVGLIAQRFQGFVAFPERHQVDELAVKYMRSHVRLDYATP
jgi:hypothetical protein